MSFKSSVVVLIMVLLTLVGAAFGQKTVKVRPVVIDDVLINPGIGFMTFQRFNGDDLNKGTGWTEGMPIDYQDFDGDLENKDHPDTSRAYLRIYWRHKAKKSRRVLTKHPRRSPHRRRNSHEE